MTTKKDETELQRLALRKSIRNAVRLKHSIAADAEINAVLPKIEADFDRAVAGGEPFGVDLASVYKLVAGR